MISGFYKKSIQERRNLLENTNISQADITTLAGLIDQETERLDRMSENIIGSLRLPLGILTGIIVNHQEHIVAMSTEEPSVVAAANRAARLINACGGIFVDVDNPVTTAQIMFVIQPDSINILLQNIISDKQIWIDLANSCDPMLISHHGGAFNLDIKSLPADDWNETFLVINLHVYTSDAMGANIVNTMAEKLQTEMIQKYSHLGILDTGMAILTNRSEGRLATAKVRLPFDSLSKHIQQDPIEFAKGIVRSSVFAQRSPERAVTHNKGILNGIIAASLPLGQDTRALSAAAYDFACRSGQHKPLCTWAMDNDCIVGNLRMPMVVGFVGGSRRHPAFECAYRLAQINSYQTLCSVLTAIGLSQNLAAIWALSTEGIQAGHMKLHNRKHAP